MNVKTASVNRKHRGFLLSCQLLLLALLLGGCGGETAAPEATPEPTPLYSVRFFLKDELLLEDSVPQGGRVEPVELARKGLDFLGWRSADGSAVKPETQTITGNTSFFAVAYPRLTNHVPYLFTDANGFLRPDDALTDTELADAVDALAEPEALPYLPYLTRSGKALTAARFEEVLSQMFPKSKVEPLFKTFLDSETVCRADAAKVLNALLGRSVEETITLRRAAFRPVDVASDRPDYTELMEAAVSHTVDSFGELWSACVLPARYAPGPQMIEGRLYCIGEDGAICVNAEWNGFSFGPDGVYTSGSAELDGYVQSILRQLRANNPDLEGTDFLRKVFEYCRDSFTYLRKAPLNYGDTGWEIEYALEMFATQLGNCYNYAATFWALTRGLGYDAKAYSGTVGSARSPHGWVEIELDGVNYIFDTELEMAYRKKGVYTYDMFMMDKTASANWTYRKAA